MYHLAECSYVECQILFIVMLNVIVLSVVLMNVIMLSVVLMNVIMLIAVLMNVVKLSVMAPFTSNTLGGVPRH
jgi:hypothetical protein